MKKKILTGLLLVSMLLGMTLTSCSSSDVDGGFESTTASDTQLTGLATEPPYGGIEQADYDGYTFRIHSNRNSDNSKIDVDALTGDLMNDKVYERNRKIEEDFNITIKLTHDESLADNLPTYVQANEDFTDLAFLSMNKLFPFAQEGYIRDWNTVDGIMLDAAWWDPRAFDQLSIGDKFYTLVGDISTEDEVVALILHYNKTMYNATASKMRMKW